MFYTCMKWKPFLLLNAVACLLLASWFVPITRFYWDQIDISVFRFLNSPLEGKIVAQSFWALANARVADFAGALVMGLFFFIYILDGTKEERPLRYAQLAYLAIWAEIGLLITKQGLDLVFDYIQYARPSCTYILEHTVRVSDAIPWLKVKDTARSCFPSTHAEILLKWMLFVTFFCGKRYVPIALFWMLVFIFPRLIVGAHWLSDAVAGSLPIALMLFAIATCTPIYGYTMNFLLKVTNTILEKFPIFKFARVKENSL
jgi:Kdo2-lipid A phosphotransferase